MSEEAREEIAASKPEEAIQDMQAQSPLEVPVTQEEEGKKQAEQKPPEPVRGFANSAFDFILNPDLEEADEDYSSSEEDESE